MQEVRYFRFSNSAGAILPLCELESNSSSRSWAPKSAAKARLASATVSPSTGTLIVFYNI